jgi:hypothetical protein
MPSKTKRYAEVSWCAVDIQSIRPWWTIKQCNEFLDDNEDHIQIAMVEAGNDAIRELLPTTDTEVSDATS